jgi:hypothetical protein
LSRLPLGDGGVIDLLAFRADQSMAALSGADVGDYRLFFLDDAGHIVRALALQCTDDAEATAWAEALGADQAVELWQLGRRVFTNAPCEDD